MTTKLVILSAPSGAGKTTVARHLLNSNLQLEFSISATSRAKRDTETEGEDYYFISSEEFRKRILNNDFLEWEEVYDDHYYGTLRSEIERIASKDHHVLFDVDVIGGLNIKKQFGTKALALFIQPPSINTLRDRLTSRSTDSMEKIEMRVEKAKFEMNHADQFDVIIVNDDLKDTLDEAFSAVENFLHG